MSYGSLAPLSAGFAVAGRTAVPRMENTTPFEASLNSAGIATVTLTDADKYRVGGLTWDQEPTASGPLCRTDHMNTTQIKIMAIGFSPADEGKRVTGYYKRA